MSSLQRALSNKQPPASYEFPPPYSMCSKEECEQREHDHELSEFECTSDTFWKSPPQRRICQQLAVTKYRRSAAGMTRQIAPRAVSSLDTTWRHVRHILCHQAVHVHQQQQPKSLLYTLAFIDDRIRAMQVDLVVSQQSAPQLQLQLARFHILELYLTCESKVEVKFMKQALWTALTSYWTRKASSVVADDEILCMTALCHVSDVLIGGEDAADGGFSSILQTYRQYASSHHQPYPQFQLALAIVAAAHAGQYRHILVLLTQYDDDDDPFYIRCRLCLSPALSLVRFQLLQQYNTSFMKRSKVSGDEMARLLFLPSSSSAVKFCVACGIPLEENDYLVLKSAPMVEPPKEFFHTNRTEDPFVFGHSMEGGGRRDEDGILIPSAELMNMIITLEGSVLEKNQNRC